MAEAAVVTADGAAAPLARRLHNDDNNDTNERDRVTMDRQRRWFATVQQ